MGVPRLNSDQIRPWGSLSWANRISMLRLLLVAPFLVLLMNQDMWAYARYCALGIFVGMAASDYLDGVLARRFNQKTRLGAILDPLADKMLIIWSVVLLSLRGTAVPEARISNWVVVAVVGKDLWVIVGFLVVYLVTDRFRVHPTLAGKVATAGQFIMVGLVLIAPDLNRLSAELGTQLAMAAGWGVAALSVVAVVSYTRLGLRFVAEGQQPLDANSSEEVQNDESD